MIDCSAMNKHLLGFLGESPIAFPLGTLLLVIELLNYIKPLINLEIKAGTPLFSYTMDLSLNSTFYFPLRGTLRH